MTREDWESQPALHWPRAVAGDAWSVVGVHHGDLWPQHPQSLRRGAMAGARGRRTLTLSHHLSMLWKSQGKEKITLFPSVTMQKLTPLSNPVNAMGRAGGNLTALTPNLHPGCHKPHLSFWALSFCQSDRGYCAKPCRPFFCKNGIFTDTECIEKLWFSNSDHCQWSTLKTSEPL